ncbi:MAG: tetratricopeptide repeat protein [Bradymonadia bacterium]
MSTVETEGLSKALRDEIDSFEPRFDDPTDLAERLMAWLDGRPASQLFKLLDDLRVRRLYPLSIALLEYAWNSDLPDDRLGRVAEDWIGTVLFGIGDRRGGEEVAEHVIKTSAQHGPAFRSDLGHLLLQWGLTELAEPVVLEAAKSLPGDMSAQFNLGVVHKLKGRWSEAVDAFETVLQFRSNDQASSWNLGIAYTALGRLGDARRMWAQVGLPMPEDLAVDELSEGELIPVRLPRTDRGAEVLWARRIGPARARLKGIALDPTHGSYNDIVLLDGVPDGETTYRDEQVPIFNVLARLALGGLAAYGLVPLDDDTSIQPLLDRLNAEVIPHADWRPLAQLSHYPVVIALSEPDQLDLLREFAVFGRWEAILPKTEE